MYLSGQSVTQDYEQAVDWFRKSAAQGNANAQSNLGVMYQNGWGVEKDLAQPKSGIKKPPIKEINRLKTLCQNQNKKIKHKASMLFVKTTSYLNSICYTVLAVCVSLLFSGCVSTSPDVSQQEQQPDVPPPVAKSGPSFKVEMGWWRR